MKVLKEELILNCTAQKLWSILSDISRCDWVPTINEITLDGECRIFEMEGMGIVKEKILLNDDSKMMLQYSAIETRTPIDHHLATMHVTEIDENSCTLTWTTEIDPEFRDLNLVYSASIPWSPGPAISNSFGFGGHNGSIVIGPA